MSYEDFRKEGIRRLEQLAGEQWTDFNPHDPGITILEQLCYALTDLGYRIDFPIEDLLSEGGASPYESLYPPAEILSCKPVTLEDLRKLVLDVDGVKNAWVEAVEGDDLAGDADLFYDPTTRSLSVEGPAVSGPESIRTEPVGLRGLYRVLIEKSDRPGLSSTTVRQNVARRLHANRALGQDFTEIRVLAPQGLRVDARLEISTIDDAEGLLLRVLTALSRVVSPPVTFRTLEGMLASGLGVEEIFEGPLLDHGFFADGAPARSTEVHTSDLIHALMDIEGVQAVKQLHIAAGDKGEPWILELDPSRVPVLDLEGSNIVLERSNLAVQVDAERVIRTYGERLSSGRAKPRARTALTPPEGRDRKAHRYESVCSQFPAVYGVGPLGLPDSAPPGRHAQARQLQAYMMFFEQLLADEHAQLGHVKDLFSFFGEDLQTYFSQKVDGRGLHLGRIRTRNKHEHKERLREIALGSDGGARSLERKNRFLSHLLARFAEQLVDFAQTPGSRAPLERLVKAKQQILQHYPRVSGGRGTASDLLQRSAVSGFEDRLRFRLAPVVDLEGSMFLVEHILLRPLTPDAEHPLFIEAVPYRDPFSLQLSLVLPDTLASHAEHVRQTARREAPAHLTLFIHWLEPTAWSHFQTEMRSWLDLRRRYRADELGLGETMTDHDRESLKTELQVVRNRLLELLALGRPPFLLGLEVEVDRWIIPHASGVTVSVPNSRPEAEYTLYYRAMDDQDFAYEVAGRYQVSVPGGEPKLVKERDLLAVPVPGQPDVRVPQVQGGFLGWDQEPPRNGNAGTLSWSIDGLEDDTLFYVEAKKADDSDDVANTRRLRSAVVLVEPEIQPGLQITARESSLLIENGQPGVWYQLQKADGTPLGPPLADRAYFHRSEGAENRGIGALRLELDLFLSRGYDTASGNDYTDRHPLAPELDITALPPDDELRVWAVKARSRVGTFVHQVVIDGRAVSTAPPQPAPSLAAPSSGALAPPAQDVLSPDQQMLVLVRRGPAPVSAANIADELGLPEEMVAGDLGDLSRKKLLVGDEVSGYRSTETTVEQEILEHFRLNGDPLDPGTIAHDLVLDSATSRARIDALVARGLLSTTDDGAYERTPACLDEHLLLAFRDSISPSTLDSLAAATSLPSSDAEARLQALEARGLVVHRDDAYERSPARLDAEILDAFRTLHRELDAETLAAELSLTLDTAEQRLEALVDASVLVESSTAPDHYRRTTAQLDTEILAHFQAADGPHTAESLALAVGLSAEATADRLAALVAGGELVDATGGAYERSSERLDEEILALLRIGGGAWAAGDITARLRISSPQRTTARLTRLRSTGLLEQGADKRWYRTDLRIDEEILAYIRETPGYQSGYEVSEEIGLDTTQTAARLEALADRGVLQSAPAGFEWNDAGVEEEILAAARRLSPLTADRLAHELDLALGEAEARLESLRRARLLDGSTGVYLRTADTWPWEILHLCRRPPAPLEAGAAAAALAISEQEAQTALDFLLATGFLETRSGGNARTPACLDLQVMQSMRRLPGSYTAAELGTRIGLPTADTELRLTALQDGGKLIQGSDRRRQRSPSYLEHELLAELRGREPQAVDTLAVTLGLERDAALERLTAMLENGRVIRDAAGGYRRSTAALDEEVLACLRQSSPRSGEQIAGLLGASPEVTEDRLAALELSGILVRDGSDWRRSDTQLDREILDFFRSAGEPCSSAPIAEAAGLSEAEAAARLAALVDRGLLAQTGSNFRRTEAFLDDEILEYTRQTPGYQSIDDVSAALGLSESEARARLEALAAQDLLTGDADSGFEWTEAGIAEEILSVVRAAGGPQSAADIAGSLGIPVAEAAERLSQLEQDGLLASGLDGSDTVYSRTDATISREILVLLGRSPDPLSRDEIAQALELPIPQIVLPLFTLANSGGVEMLADKRCQLPWEAIEDAVMEVVRAAPATVLAREVAQGADLAESTARAGLRRLEDAGLVELRGSRYAFRTGLVASWRFDEGEGDTLVDQVRGLRASIEPRDSTQPSGHQWVTDSGTDSSVERAVLQLDGTSAIRLPPDMRIDFSRGLTLEYLVALDSSSSQLYSNLQGPYNPKGMLVLQRGSMLVCYLFHDSCTVGFPAFPASDPKKSWRHVALTHDGSSFNFIVDGKVAGSRTGINPFEQKPSTRWNQLILGAGYGQYTLSGKIAGFRIWNRGLDASEFQDLWTPPSDPGSPP